MLLATLGASLLGNLLTVKRFVRAGYGNNKGKRVLRAGYGNNNKVQGVVRAGELRFNGVYSRNNLPKQIKDGAYVINLDEYKDTGTHWVALFCKKKRNCLL